MEKSSYLKFLFHLDNILIEGCTNAPMNSSDPNSAGENEFTINEEETIFNARQELKVFPNPVEKTLNIFDVDDNLEFEIFDMFGASIKRGTTEGTVDVEYLDSGTYIIRTVDGRVARFIKAQL